MFQEYITNKYMCTHKITYCWAHFSKPLQYLLGNCKKYTYVYRAYLLLDFAVVASYTPRAGP